MLGALWGVSRSHPRLDGNTRSRTRALEHSNEDLGDAQSDVGTSVSESDGDGTAAASETALQHVCGRPTEGFGTLLGCQRRGKTRVTSAMRRQESSSDSLDRAEEQLLAKVTIALDEKALSCPITRCLMEEPVIAADGYTYEREAILKHMALSSKSPMGGIALRPRRGTAPLIANRMVKEMCDQLRNRAREAARQSHVEEVPVKDETSAGSLKRTRPATNLNGAPQRKRRRRKN